MVTSIVPGGAGANALGVDAHFARGQAPAPQRREDAMQGDRVELSAATLAQARESVRAGVAQIHEALAVGHDAQAMLVKLEARARAGDQAELDAALKTFSQRLEGAIARGARVLAGEDVAVHAEPGSPPVTIAGADLRLKADPTFSDIIAVSANAKADDPTLAQSVQKSMGSLEAAMTRLVDQARSLEAHQGFLGAAEAAASVRDLDADGARLLALQVRQGLEASGAGSIANVEPQAVLSLFRA